VQKNKKIILQTFGKIRTSSYVPLLIEKKGSLTIEAAVVLPLFFLAMVTLISIMDLLRIQAQTSITLNETAKELGMYAYTIQQETDDPDSSVISLSQGACIAYAQTKLATEPNADISMIKSTYQNHRIILRASGTYRFPVSFFLGAKISFQNQVQVHGWTGYDGEQDGYDQEGGGELIYVTDWESVYHTYSDCTHLELSIQQVSYESIEERRNVDGGKYKSCSHCIEDGEESQYVFIADNGERFHSSQNCQSLKRTVHLMEQSQVAHLEECERCRQRK
jgi:hypothetical protein